MNVSKTSILIVLTTLLHSMIMSQNGKLGQDKKLICGFQLMCGSFPSEQVKNGIYCTDLKKKYINWANSVKSSVIASRFKLPKNFRAFRTSKIFHALKMLRFFDVLRINNFSKPRMVIDLKTGRKKMRIQLTNSRTSGFPVPGFVHHRDGIQGSGVVNNPSGSQAR